MISQRLANIIGVIAVLAACLYFAWVAQGFVTTGLLASSGLPSKFFPQLTLALIALCALLVGAAYLFRGESGGDADQTVFANAAEGFKGLAMLVVAVVCYFIWREFGFIAMAVLLGPLSLLAMGVRSPITYGIVWALTLFVYLVFVYGLGVRLI